MGFFIIAIVGRPNVGKSTFFNRILGTQQAIVHDVAGVTRDRHYAEAEWAGKSFTIIDTGGFVPASTDVFEQAIREQAHIAIEEADDIIFMVDAISGLTPMDFAIAEILRKSDKKAILVVNKVDNDKREMDAGEFYRLGLGQPYSISAINGRNIGDFLDTLTSAIPQETENDQRDERLRLAVIGRPNVGKSSYVNALIGQNKSIVTDIPGTTRDPIDSIYQKDGKEFIMIDTAGLRKKGKVKESIEFYSTIRTMRSIERCSVALVLVDAAVGVERQDLRIIQSAVERKKGVLIVVNKWDLIEKDTNTARQFELALQRLLGSHSYIPVIFVSAKSGQRVGKAIEIAESIHEERRKEIPTNKLNSVILPEIQRTPPSSTSGKEIKIKYITQVKAAPPVIAFFTNEPKLIQENYRRFLENILRQNFGFSGVPLSLVFKQK
jgi:GTP-binding protein